MAENQDNSVDARSDGAVDETVSSEAAPESPPTKPRRGRPKGSVNKVNRIAKEAITAAAPHAFLIRVMEGRVFKRAGEEGGQRAVTVRPTLTQSINASETLLRKIAPDIRAQEISGPGGEPITVQKPKSSRDICRRLLFFLNEAGMVVSLKGAELAEASASSGALQSPAAAPALALSNPPADAADAPQGAQAGISGTSEAEAKPTEPKVGERACVADYIVECAVGSRANLPPSYSILDSGGRLLTHAVGGWDGALQWCREKAGNPDALVNIEKAPPHYAPNAQVRPVNRKPSARLPEVHRRR